MSRLPSNPLPVQDGHVNFYDAQTLSQAEPASRFKPHNGKSKRYQKNNNIPLLIFIPDAVSTVKFRPLGSHLLTVSGARHFVAPEESDSDGGSDVVANDDNGENTGSQMRIAIRDSSIKLWDLSASGVH